MWTADFEDIPGGHRIRIDSGETPISFRSYLDLLERDEDFRRWYAALLGGSDYEAFFWEHPPICNANIDSDAEFVLLESTTLAGLSADPKPFRPYFERDNDIVSFRSLGGDAFLIAPTPTEPLAACAHLAAFVRDAPVAQVQNLWHETGKAVRENLHDRNLWLSTSGLGVTWLHIRLDSDPKYYQHRPYAAMHARIGLR
jgi:hypothetical protein